MKKIFFNTHTAVMGAAIATLLFSSCKKDSFTQDTGTAKVEITLSKANGRLVFPDVPSFYKTLERLDKTTPAELDKFEQQYGFSSFRSSIAKAGVTHNYTAAEEDLAMLPPGIQTVLNSTGEVQIGDDLVWYAGGTKYYAEKKDEALMARIKQNPEICTKKGKYTVTPVKPAGNSTQPPANINEGHTPNTIYITNGADARHQREFWQNSPAAGWRKYVHEVAAYTDYSYVASNTCGQATYYYYTGCYLYIKLEWRGTKWRPAGESREINYNLTCSGSTSVARGCGIVDYLGFNTTPSGSTVQNSQLNLTLAGFSGYTVSNSAYYPIGWAINIEGTIYQHVVGDSQYNEWYNTGYPLW
jgi:hypothetical protein